MIYDLSSLIDEAELEDYNHLFIKYTNRIKKIYPNRSTLTFIKEKKIIKKHLKTIFSIDLLKQISIERSKNVFFYRMIDLLKQKTFFTLPFIKYKYGNPTYLNINEIYEKFSKKRKNLLNEIMEKKLKKRMHNYGIEYIFNFLETSNFNPTKEVDELYLWQPSRIIREKGFWYIALHNVFPNFQINLLERIKYQIINSIKNGYKVKTIKDCLEQIPLNKFLSSHLSEFGLKNIEKYFNPLSINQSINFFSRKYIQNVEEMEPELNIVLLDFIFSNIDLYNYEYHSYESLIENPFLVISHTYWCDCETYGIKGTNMENNEKLKKTCQNFQKYNFIESKIDTDFNKSDFWNFIEPGICIKFSTISFNLDISGFNFYFDNIPLEEYLGLINKDNEFKNIWIQRGINWELEIINN